MKKKNHIFKQLGKAPYQLVHAGEGETACDYCGTYIRNVFVCKGSDNKKFVLGSSCVEKLGDKGLIKEVKEAQKRKNQEKKWAEQAERQQAYIIRRQEELAEQEAQKAERIEVMKAEFQKVLPKIKDTPHPNAYFASKGKTMLDYLEYFLGDIEDWKDDYFFYNTKLLIAIREAGGDV